jgi:hypothetical protein
MRERAEQVAEAAVVAVAERGEADVAECHRDDLAGRPENGVNERHTVRRLHQ